MLFRCKGVRNGDADMGSGLEDMGRGKGGLGRSGGWHGHVYTAKCRMDGWWEAATWHREISSVLCAHLEGWGGEGGGKAWEGGDMGMCVYVWLIHFVV